MIYLLATFRVVPGKMKEFNQVFENEMLPASKKVGWKLVAQWSTSVGTMNEITDLWGYDDLIHMQHVQEAMAKSPEFQKALEHVIPLIEYETTKLMMPTPFSSLK